jgi:hypothetical protein
MLGAASVITYSGYEKISLRHCKEEKHFCETGFAEECRMELLLHYG